MKEDERTFLLALYENPHPKMPRDVIETMPINEKRAYYILAKWNRKGWYDYGVSIGTGWLEEAGKAKAMESK